MKLHWNQNHFQEEALLVKEARTRRAGGLQIPTARRTRKCSRQFRLFFFLCRPTIVVVYFQRIRESRRGRTAYNEEHTSFSLPRLQWAGTMPPASASHFPSTPSFAHSPLSFSSYSGFFLQQERLLEEEIDRHSVDAVGADGTPMRGAPAVLHDRTAAPNSCGPGSARMPERLLGGLFGPQRLVDILLLGWSNAAAPTLRCSSRHGISQPVTPLAGRATAFPHGDCLWGSSKSATV